MTVLQKWLEEIPIRMQSTLILGLRGPDTHRCPEIKKVQRWLRGLAFKPGNPDNVREFMTSLDDVPELFEKGPLARELEFYTQHFYSHLMHSLEVVAFLYPKPPERAKAYALFVGMCKLFHLPSESRDDFGRRLRTITWPSGRQPENLDDALDMLL